MYQVTLERSSDEIGFSKQDDNIEIDALRAFEALAKSQPISNYEIVSSVNNQEVTIKYNWDDPSKEYWKTNEFLKEYGLFRNYEKAAPTAAL